MPRQRTQCVLVHGQPEHVPLNFNTAGNNARVPEFYVLRAAARLLGG